nr:oxidoreductase [Kibdelosporangium sp. MJ126-NF4]CEL20581.1 Oxidoreductase, short chain dehydrogenase/reductase family [Kibdelosporangium sp. MJ126-NF4]CTQ89492.1 Oxidoreductase, short chain dehydrogenase/reductase family [Kibdelosporangium sp. MJ126-NF4]
MTSHRIRTWLITGASQGLGRAFAEAALDAGEAVVATSRTPESLKDLAGEHGERLTILPLDVTNRSEVLVTVTEAARAAGGIDVLVTNAGYGLSGAVEEVDERQARDQMDVNFFGALWCVQAVLPVMRAQGSGHIFQISSIAAIATYPNLGMYCASKWALDGMSESLASEVAGFGIGVTIVELGEFRTKWSAGSMARATPMPEYDEVLAKWRHGMSGAYADIQPGDPRKAGAALLRVLDSAKPPLRLLLGTSAAELAPRVYRERIGEWAEWDDLARAVDHHS